MEASSEATLLFCSLLTPSLPNFEPVRAASYHKWYYQYI